MPHSHYKTHQIETFEPTLLANHTIQNAIQNDIKPLRRSEDKLALLEKLNRTIELEPLLATYTAEVSRLLPVSGLEFDYLEHKLQLKYSKASNCHLIKQLEFDHQNLGRISYFSSQALSERQRQLLAAVEQQLLQPLYNVIRFEHSRRLSMRDFLTDLGNRNYFEEMIRHMMATSTREKRSFSLLFVDLDNFKTVNDNYGHLAGDRVLVEFSRLLNAAVRTNDYVFRFGGDEFSLLLDHSEHLNPEFVARRIINLTNQSQLLSGHRVTASIGYVNWQPQDSSSGLIERADRALYRVKHQGKNGYSAAN